MIRMIFSIFLTTFCCASQAAETGCLSKLGSAYQLHDLELLQQCSQRAETPQHMAVAGLLGVLVALARNDESTARRLLNRSLDKLEKSDQPPAFALQSILYGQKLRINPWSGVFHGSKPKQFLDKAAEAGEHPTLWLAKASYFHYTPTTFGGDPKQAIGPYLKLLELSASHWQRAVAETGFLSLGDTHPELVKEYIQWHQELSKKLSGSPWRTD